MSLLAYTSAERGRTAQLAAAIGMHPVLISQWAHNARPVPSEHCPQLERATEGAVTCEEMRPDVTWVRIPDPDWPHPQGRPLLDVAQRRAKAVA
jgi:DNA-binding transcriptional regulator YdaS (Cro superfamily)